MRFYVQHSPPVEEGRLLVLAQALSTVTVDLFRLLYVLSSEEAMATNMSRLAYFMEIAEEHAIDFQAQLASLSGSLDPKMYETLSYVERDCRWILGQLRRRDDIVFEAPTCFSVICRICDKAYEAFTIIIPNQLAEAEGAVLRVYGNLIPHGQRGSIQNLRIRHDTQAMVLASSESRQQIRTIAHDAAQSHALHYFLIDRLLLNPSPQTD